MRIKAKTLLVMLALLSPLVHAQKKQAFDDVVSRYAAFGFRGTVLVAKKGKPLFEQGYGLADAKKGRENDADTLFELASLTKQFTAAAILRLEQDGKLSVDDSIAEHLPGVPDHSRKITIHHLLAHTSGVPRENTGGRGSNLENAVVAYLGEGPTSPPGEEWAYWNGGYALLAGIVEEVSGETYMEYCLEHLFKPAKMKDTGFTGSRKLDKKRAAHNEKRSAIEHPYGEYGWQYKGMGGAVSTVGDLLRWHSALQDDTVLNEDAREKLFKPHVEGKAHGSDYGYGWYLGRAPDGTPMAFHGGDVRGFHCMFRRYPKIDGCVVVLANSPGGPLRSLAANLETELFKSTPRAELPPETVPMKAKQLKRYAGTYVGPAGETVEITVADAGLWLDAEGSFAATLTGDEDAKSASFAVMPTSKDDFAAWNFRRTLPVEFESKSRKVRKLKAAGLVFERK